MKNNALLKKTQNFQIKVLFPYIAFIVITLIFSFLARDRFLTIGNFKIILQQAAVLAITAFGLHFCIIRGGIDLSVGSVLCVAGLIGADMAQKYGAVAGLLAGLFVGLFFGLCNGLIHTFLYIPSFIVTLGMQKIARGFAYMYSRSEPISLIKSLKFIGKWPTIIYITLIVFVITYILYNYTRFGRYALAVGGDLRVAELNGVPVKLVSICVYMFSDLLAGLAGMIMAGRLGSAVPTTGIGYESQAIAAVAMGGAPLTGGTGSVTNTLIGAFITATLCNGLTIVGVDTEMQQVFTGLLLIFAVAISLDRKKVGMIR